MIIQLLITSRWYEEWRIKSAERIAKIHEALGIDVFFDKHRLKAGYIYSEEISRFIQAADTFVLCWSENAAESDYVEKEHKEELSLAYPQTKRTYKPHNSPYNIKPHATPLADMIEHFYFEELLSYANLSLRQHSLHIQPKEIQ